MRTGRSGRHLITPRLAVAKVPAAGAGRIGSCPLVHPLLGGMPTLAWAWVPSVFSRHVGVRHGHASVDHATRCPRAGIATPVVMHAPLPYVSSGLKVQPWAAVW